MKINGIDYFVAIYIMDTDDLPEYDTHFEDFHALNAFIRENANNPKYINSKVCYSLVENIDGEPDGFSWVSNFEWQEFTEEQIQTEIDIFVEEQEENPKIFAERDQFAKEIHYYDSGADHKKKQSHFEDIAYVCPSCIRSVEDCRCEGYPYYLVQIDKLMVPIIRELNSKGYKTTGCCAGHPRDDAFKVSGIYIAFAEDYDFDEPFPDGGKYSKSRCTITYTPNEEDYDDLVGFQMDVLQQLEDWAEMLFDNDFSTDVEDSED